MPMAANELPALMKDSRNGSNTAVGHSGQHLGGMLQTARLSR